MKRASVRSSADVDAPVMARLESEAQRGDRRADHKPTRPAFAPLEHNDRLSAEPGRKLPDPIRATMQRRLGRDFSMVRLHDSGDAQRVAENSGARAVAYGNDVAFAPSEFAPHKPAGLDLLAHELTHVGQQQSVPAPFVARDAKTGQKGAGAEPPSEQFVRMDSAGPEEGHALFELNSDTLADDAAGTLVNALGRPTAPVTVHVHGYASREGDATWNMNLSANRGVAAKHALERALPEGSRIVVFAHGGTAEFGALANNRRVGVSLMGPVETGGFKLKPFITQDMHFDLTPKPRSDTPLLDPSKPLLPQLGGGLGGGVTPTIPPKESVLGPVILPPITRRDKMDLAGMASGMAAHGIAPGQFGDVVAMWDASFLRYKAMGMNDDWAARLANMQVSGTLSSQAARDAPNAIDRANADWSAAHPDEKATPVIQSPNLLDLFSKKKKKE